MNSLSVETEAIIGRVNESDERMKELYVTDDEARAIIGNRKIVAFDPEKSDIIYGVMKKKERFISCKSKA